MNMSDTQPILNERDRIINKMCFTMRPDFAMIKYDDCSYITSGMTDTERTELKDKMTQLYDACVGEAISSANIPSVTWINTSFKGHHPIGTAAIVVANNQKEASILLEKKLESVGLMQPINPSSMLKLDMTVKKALILYDGNKI